MTAHAMAELFEKRRLVIKAGGHAERPSGSCIRNESYTYTRAYEEFAVEIPIAETNASVDVHIACGGR